MPGEPMSANTEDWLHRHRLTVDEYYRMAEVGLLAPDARVELIEGEIIDMAPPGSRHSGVISFLNQAITTAVGRSAIVSVQLPLRLSQMSEPQPDFTVLRRRKDFYSRNHPTAADVLLLIEVSDSSARYDRQIKLPLYARHGVHEFWQVDVSKRELSMFRSPQDGNYAEVTTTKAPGELVPELLPQARIDLTGLFDL